MKKTIYHFLLSIMWIFVPSICFASKFIPKQCSIGNRPLDKPLNYVELIFDDGIELKENAKAFITHEDVEIITSSSFEITKFPSYSTESFLTIFFNGDYLPKGETYTFHLAENSVCLSDSPEINNDDYSVTFSIPNDLGEASFDLHKDGDIIKSERYFSCNWRFEVTGVDSPQWELYRENELIRTYPADISCDWDLGSAFLDLKERLNFEDGVNFRLVLPAGSAQAARTDIVNKEVVLNFIGGYKEPMKYPSYYWCSLYKDHPSVIHEVCFYYNIPIALIPEKPLILSGVNGNEYKSWSAFPVLSFDGQNWILSADFGGIELEQGWGYTVEIPEGTIVTANGDVTVNHKQSAGISRSGITGIDMSETNNSIPEAQNENSPVYNLEGLKMNQRQPGKIYIQNGKKVVVP